MSFILDALKKSEHERQRQSMPGLVESGVVRPKPGLPTWAIALCALLGINLIVLMVMLARSWMIPRSDQRTDVAAPVTRQLTQQSADALPRTLPHDDGVAGGGQPFSPLDDAPLYAPEIPAAAATTPPPVTRQASPVASPGDHPNRRRDPVLSDDDYKVDDEEVLPSINELNLTGAQALPDLHLDVHVFATRSAERFVFINMRKYHEGATLQEGPMVERIRRDGVILDYRGVRFLLPRQ